jgi:uroporphyrinogen decarboxylase
MTNKERVIAVIHHHQPDKIPYHVDFTQKAHQKMVSYLGDPHFRTRFNNCLHYLSFETDQAWREVAPDIWADEFGVQWDRHIDKDIGVVHNLRITPTNLEEYRFPDPDASSRYHKFQAQMGTTHFIVANLGFSLFERAWTLAGMENILMGMVANPEFVHQLLDRILEYNLRLIENAVQYPIDAVMFGDDWGQQSGLIMGPRLWREFIKPRIARMYQAVKKGGKYVMIHSCGKVHEIFPDLIEVGVDVFNPFQPEVTDVYEMKRRFGASLSFFGGISTQYTLPFGSISAVKTEVQKLINEVGANGGYIAAPAHAVQGDARPENILAMWEVLESQ